MASRILVFLVHPTDFQRKWETPVAIPRLGEEPLSVHKSMTAALAIYGTNSAYSANNLVRGGNPVWCPRLQRFLDFRYEHAWEEWKARVALDVSQGKASILSDGRVIWGSARGYLEA